MLCISPSIIRMYIILPNPNQPLANIISSFIIFLVDGGWSDWQNVTNCSTTCGEGVITQQRTCTQPSPSCGGRDCLGENITYVSCTKCCPGTYINLRKIL